MSPSGSPAKICSSRPLATTGTDNTVNLGPVILKPFPLKGPPDRNQVLIGGQSGSTRNAETEKPDSSADAGGMKDQEHGCARSFIAGTVRSGEGIGQDPVSLPRGVVQLVTRSPVVTDVRLNTHEWVVARAPECLPLAPGALVAPQPG